LFDFHFEPHSVKSAPSAAAAEGTHIAS